MNCHAVRLIRLTAGAGAALLLSSCRLRSPVERHFLRMPAESTAGLSSIERAWWLKDSRSSLPGRRELKATGILNLPSTSTPRGVQVHRMQVMHLPSGEDGGLASIACSATHAGPPARLHLVEQRKFIYTDVTDALLGPGGGLGYWKLDPARHAVTGTSGRNPGPQIVFTWNGQRWVRGRQ